MIDTSNWKKFKVSDVFITEKHGSVMQVPTGAMMAKKDLVDGNIPRVTVSNYNNGITGYYADFEDKNYRTFENFISVSFLGTVFYQPEKTSLDMKVHCLKPRKYKLNEYSAGYIVSVIRRAISNFAYSDQLSSTLLADLEFMLPAKTKVVPDFEELLRYIYIKNSSGGIDMSKIDATGWKEFKVGNLFQINHGSRLNQANRIEGSIPFLTAGFENQGVSQHIGNDVKVYRDPLSIDMFGNCFFHEGMYAGDDNIYFLTNDKISNETKICLASIISATIKEKYNYSNQFRQNDAYNLTILLPAKKEYEPDWQYMEDYMRKILEESEESLENLRKANNTKHLIDVSEWGEFRVGKLFKKLDLKCHKKFNKAADISTEQTDEFDLPLVNAKHNNNGIMYYGRSNDWDSAEMTIDIVGDGAASTGDVYAQPQRTGVLYNAYLVKPLWNCTSEYVLQFMACVIERCVKSHFGYENKCTWDKVSQESIYLPIASTGEPDWQYMEKYMKRIMKETDARIENYSKRQMKVGGNK